MKLRYSLMLLFVGAAVLAGPLSGGVPRLVNYQGFLTDNSAVPLDGSYNLTFKIYADSTQGAQALWTELHSNVDVDEGLFNVLLGGTTLLPDSLWGDAERWMGITVGGDPEMYPRMRLTSVPWALRAAVADSALSSPAGSADGHSLDAADGTPVDAVYVDDNGNVGVGTLAPGAKLDVAGTLLVSAFKMPTGAVSGYVLVSDGAGVGTWQQVGAGGGGDITAVLPMDGLWSPDSGESGDVHLYVLVVPGSGLMVDAIDGLSIQPEGVTEDKIAASAVTTAKLDSAAVTGAKIASEAVGASALAGAAVTNEKLAAYAVADSNLIANAVTTDKLLNNAVKRDKIDNLAINTDKLDAGAVTSAKIQDNTISFDDVAQNDASEGQVMKWTGGHWVARDDSVGGGGTVTGVGAGLGLTGGGGSGYVTLDVDFGGTGVGTAVARSDHQHDAAYVNEGQVVSIGENMLIDGSVTTAKLDTNAVTTEKILTGTILFDDLGQNGAADGQVIKWSGAASAWVAADDSAGTGGGGGSGGWYDGGSVVRLETAGDSVGIGTAAPTEKLDVAGNVRASGKAAFGPGHVYPGVYAFVAGQKNAASGDHSTVGGGINNIAHGDYAVVSGGGGDNPSWFNRAFGNYSVVGGGTRNTAGDTLASANEDEYATVGGGYGNQALGRGATIGGGAENQIGQAGGGPDDTGDYAAIGGGRYNRARGKYSVVSGGGGETGPWVNRAEGDYSVVGGGEYNVAGNGGSPETSTHATVSGGEENNAPERHSTVGGGRQNSAGGPASVVAGGAENTALSSHSAVGGGNQNTASGAYGTIGGGASNVASGSFAAVPGGWNNVAEGDYSIAAGSVAKARHDGCVVISATGSGIPGDSVWTNGSSEMVLRADNGFYLTNQGEQAAVNGFLGTSTGAWLSLAGQWRDASSRELKENFSEVDKNELLEKLVALPVTQWNYKMDGDDVKHVGPVAEDFYAAFRVGDDDVTISALDAAGVSLAAIQELARRNEDQKKEIEALKTHVRELQEMVRILVARQKEKSDN